MPLQLKKLLLLSTASMMPTFKYIGAAVVALENQWYIITPLRRAYSLDCILLTSVFWKKFVDDRILFYDII